MIASAYFRPSLGLHTGLFCLPKRVALIGHPVSQSLSGALQQAAFDELGIDARYEPLDVPLIKLPDTIEELRGDDFLGANISFPYKERVVADGRPTDRGGPGHRRRRHHHPRGLAG